MVETQALDRLPTATSLDDLAYRALKEAIIAGRLKDRAPLVEAALAAQLGVSKTPVRSALRRLEAEGFVHKVPHGGAHVAALSLRDVQDLYTVRSVLEGLAVRLATPLHTEADIHEMASLLAAAERACEARDLQRTTEWGSRWHSLLRRPVENRFLSDILRLLYDHIERARRLTSMEHASALQSIQEHYAVLQAVRLRNAELAEERMRAHLARVVLDFAQGDGTALTETAGQLD